MKRKDMLEHVQEIDNSLTKIYQELVTLQEELKDTHRVLRKIARSKNAREIANEYITELLRYPKT